MTCFPDHASFTQPDASPRSQAQVARRDSVGRFI